MVPTIVFFISLSSISFEILISRGFAITQWNPLCFFVISMALFGFAASGTMLSILESVQPSRQWRIPPELWMHRLTIIYCVSVVAALVVFNIVPLDYIQLLIDKKQMVYLLAIYLTFAIPFFIAGTVIALAYLIRPAQSGYVYCCSMVGSAMGAIIPAIVVPYVGETTAIWIMGLVPGGALLILGFWKVIRNKGPFASPLDLVKWSIWVMMLALVLFFGRHQMVNWISIAPSPYKELSQMLLYPNTRIMETHNNIRGRVDRVSSPYIRYCPALSLTFTDNFPSQEALFTDGEGKLVLYHYQRLDELDFSRYSLAWAGYVTSRPLENVLVISSNGGTAIARALVSKARQVTVIVPNAHVARMVQDHYHLPVFYGNPGAYLMKIHGLYDRIELEDWGASIPGADALHCQPLFTLNAFKRYLDHLTPDGRIIVSRKLQLPPSNTLRLWATAYQALSQSGIPSPQKHLIMIRNWDTFCLVVSASPVTDTQSVEQFIRDMNFDVVWLPKATPYPINRFNVLKQPYYHQQIQRLARAYEQQRQTDFFRAYPLDVSVQTDDRPYPGRILKWSRLSELYQMTGKRVYVLFLSSEIAVCATFIIAGIITLILVGMAKWFALRQAPKLPLSATVFFSGTGAGFMFVELYFIYALTVLFADSVISFMVVLGAMLTFSGFGGILSLKLSEKQLPFVLVLAICVLLVGLWAMEAIVDNILKLSVMGQLAVVLAVLFPVGLILGIPFPVGMRRMLTSSRQRAQAWVINGATSVLAAVASAHIGLAAGHSKILSAGIVAYGVTLWATLAWWNAAKPK